MMHLFTMICFSFILSISSVYGKAKIVFLYGDKSHASGDHEFRAGSMLLANHLNRQNKVDVEALCVAGWPKDEKTLDDADAIVVYCDATEIIGDHWEKMDALASKGVGMLFIHFAIHPKPDQGEKFFKPWIGAQ
jgi:hypothetical protein